MFDGRLSVHHLVEGMAIPVAVAELEPCFCAEDVDVLVVGESIELARKRVLADCFERRGRCIHEQLQGGQPLLAIDDAARLEVTEDRLPCLNHDRAKEVLGIGRRLPEPEIRQPPNVLPQRRPLLFLLPDVRPLERRHHEVLRLHEDVLRRPDVRFHQTAPSVC